MSNPRYKLVLRPEFSTNGGIRSLNGLPEQPFVDTSGNIDMCGNYLLVKNIEAGTETFTTNGEIGIINVFSDSTNTNTSCICFNHDISGNNRRYCSFQPNDTNFIAGSITGNSTTVSYNTTSDARLKQNIRTINNQEFNPFNTKLGDISYNTWLDPINDLRPCTFTYDASLIGVSSSYEQFTYQDVSGGQYLKSKYQGFLAGEVQKVYPPAVSGISGEFITDSNGTRVEVYQQLDMTKLIPMMVGAIQELSLKVTTLESIINANSIKKTLGVKYTSSNGLFSYTINNTNMTYDSNDYYQPIVDAIEKWDSLVGIPTIYTTNSNYIYTALDININFSELRQNILGGAYITHVTSPGDTNKYGNTFAKAGVFNLNTLYLTSMKNSIYNNGYSQLYYTALHEIGHVLGIGPLWSSPHIIRSIPRTSYEEDGQTKYYYTGENAVAQYKSYFPNSISESWIGIPLEDDGGQGTQNTHPEEGSVIGENGSISLATRTINNVIYYGLNHELMTGWSESAVEMPLSRVTLGFLQDIGYNVNYALADDYTATY